MDVKKAKVNVMIDRLNIGGVEKTAIIQVRELRSQGVQSKLWILSRKSIVQGAFSDLLKDIPVEYLEDRLPGPLRFTFRIPPAAFFSLFHLTYSIFLPFVIKSSEVDYIIGHGSYTTFTAVTLKKFRGIHYSIYFWDPVGYILNRVYSNKISKILIKFLNFIGETMDKTLVRNADYVITASTTHNDYFRNTCKAKDSKLIFIPPGAPLGSPSAEKDNSVIVVTAYKAGKDPNYILEIAEKLPNVKFKVIGKWLDPQLKNDFINMRKKMKLEKTVEIMGAANEKQLSEYYPKAAVLLTTNLEVGFGMPVLEAAAWGTTSIVPKGSGVCVVFEDSIDAFYTSEKDTNDIVEKLTLLTSDTAKAKEMGLNAYKKVKTDYTWQEHGKKLYNLLSTI